MADADLEEVRSRICQLPTAAHVLTLASSRSAARVYSSSASSRVEREEEELVVMALDKTNRGIHSRPILFTPSNTKNTWQRHALWSRRSCYRTSFNLDDPR